MTVFNDCFLQASGRMRPGVWLRSCLDLHRRQ